MIKNDFSYLKERTYTKFKKYGSKDKINYFKLFYNKQREKRTFTLF